MKDKKIIFGCATLIWVGVIFFFTLQPGETSGNISESVLFEIIHMFSGIFGKPEDISYQTLEKWHYVLRKCAHFTEYMILGILSAETLIQMKRKYAGRYSLLFCVIIAALDETTQRFVPGRAGRVQDVIIDSAGALAGICLLCFILKYISKGHSKNG